MMINNAPAITSASLLLAEDCNLACDYCFENQRPRKKQRMSPETVEKSLAFLIENARKINQKSVNATFFGGEPMLNIPGMKAAFEKAEANNTVNMNPRITYNIITNATILTDEHIALFKQYRDMVGLTIQLSIDGLPKIQNTHRKTRSGKPSWPMIEKNIPRFKKLFEGKPGNLNVHGCLTRESLSQLYESFCFYTHELQIHNLWYLPIYEEPWSEDDVLLYEKEIEKITNDILKRAKQAETKNEASRILGYYAPLDRYNRCGRSNRPCGAGYSYVNITADGHIYPCHQFYFTDRSLCIGHIDHGVDDHKRRLFIEYDSSDMSCPDDCDHSACYRCIAANYMNYGSIFSQQNDGYCQMMKIDQKYQRVIKEEAEKLGILNQNSNADCLCDSRGTGCDMVCNQHNPDGSKSCDVVHRDNELPKTVSMSKPNLSEHINHNSRIISIEKKMGEIVSGLIEVLHELDNLKKETADV